MNQHTRKSWVTLTKVGEKLDISAALTHAAENLLTLRCGLIMLAALLLSQAQLPMGSLPFGAALNAAMLLAGEPVLPVWIGCILSLLIRWQPVNWLNGWPLISCILLTIACRMGLERKGWKVALGVCVTSLVPLPFLSSRLDTALAFLIGGLGAGALTPAFWRGYLALTGVKRPMSADERLCCLLMAAGLCLGGGPLQGEWLRSAPVMGSGMTMCVAFAGGAGLGGTCGLFLGLAMLCCGETGQAAAVLAISGLIGGLMKSASRILGLSACGTACVLASYAMGAGEGVLRLLPSVLAGQIVFLALPVRVLDALAGRLKEGEMDYAPSAAPLLLHAGARAMADMARALPTAGEKEERLPVEMLACRLCSGCTRQQECWDSRCAQSLKLMDELLWASGRGMEEIDIRECAKRAGCIRAGEAAEMAAGLLKSCREKAREDARKAQVRVWAMEQLKAQARALGEMGERLEEEEEEAARARSTLLHTLPSLRGRSEAVAAASLRGRLHVWLDDVAVGGAAERMQGVLSRALGMEMEWMGEPQARGWHLYVKKPRFSLEMGKAQKPIEGEEVCGDSVLCRRLDGGRALIALSDGMGSGKRAKEESRSALELLLGALRAGYQRQDALNLVNSLMMACRGDEMFATMDVCVVNLDSGEAVLEKLGACPTFLLRRGKCRRMGQSTLPVGILEAVHPRTISARLEKNDVVLMVSDGVTDAFGGEDVQLLRALGGLLTGDTPQPQRLAETLLHRALERCRGEASDDMTVLAVRIA